jgi:hypothetical protein
MMRAGPGLRKAIAGHSQAIGSSHRPWSATELRFPSRTSPLASCSPVRQRLRQRLGLPSLSVFGQPKSNLTKSPLVPKHPKWPHSSTQSGRTRAPKVAALERCRPQTRPRSHRILWSEAAVAAPPAKPPGKSRRRSRPLAKLLPPPEQLAGMDPAARATSDATALLLQRSRDDPLLLRPRPSPPLLWRWRKKNRKNKRTWGMVGWSAPAPQPPVRPRGGGSMPKRTMGDQTSERKPGRATELNGGMLVSQ